jgi:hypothetical protein
MRSGAHATWDSDRHQPSRGEHDSRAPVHRRQTALPWQSWTLSCTTIMSPTKCRGALTPALQAAPSLLAWLDSQIVRRQQVSPAAMAWNSLPPDFAPIDIGEVDDRRTISRDQAPATTGSSRQCQQVTPFRPDASGGFRKPDGATFPWHPTTRAAQRTVGQ